MCPALHSGWQVPGFEPNLCVPAAQIEQVPPLAPMYSPLHTQAVADALPATEVEKEGHPSQVPGSEPTLYVPARHPQSVAKLLPAAEVDREGHPSQVPESEPTLYVPARQIEQVAPFVPVYPASHTHASIAMLPAADDEFEGQV